MIRFHYETEFQLDDEAKFADWASRIIASEKKMLSTIDYVFCSDSYLLELNIKHLNHDKFTDIITFDYSELNYVGGDIFISIDRVKENAVTFKTGFDQELLRVMAHGLLHLLGYKDKTNVDKTQMRSKENDKIKLFHVEH